MDDLLDVLATHECKVKITNNNLPKVIDQIGHKEIVQQPSFIKECFFDVLMSYGLNIDIKEQCNKLIPTAKKLLSLLDCDEHSDSDSLKFLKRYIREIDSDGKLLRTFLRFLTASDLLLYDSNGHYYQIVVRLVDLTGIARRPVAHTCGRVLELPKF